MQVESGNSAASSPFSPPLAYLVKTRHFDYYVGTCRTEKTLLSPQRGMALTSCCQFGYFGQDNVPRGTAWTEPPSARLKEIGLAVLG
jgi:hypothetical protein